MRDDQALGLRRLFARRRTRLLGVIGEDNTDVALELARAFGSLDYRVLMLDRTCGDATQRLGLRARSELKHALTGERRLEDVALHGPPNVVVLPAARALAALDAADAAQWLPLCGRLDDALGPFDVMLVNGPPPALQDANVLLTLAPTATAVTRAYTDLKMLSRRGVPRRCDILVHRARSEAAALDAFDSVAITAGRFLGMSLALAGSLPGAPGRILGSDPRRAAAAALIADRLVRDPLPEPKAVNL